VPFATPKGVGGEVEEKCRSLTLFANKSDAAMHLLDDGFGDAQSEARSGDLRAWPFLGLREGLEDLITKVCWNTRPTVLDRDPDLSPQTSCLHGDLTTSGGEFYSVREEIGEYLLQPTAIGSHH
jgi:hypothetical protein